MTRTLFSAFILLVSFTVNAQTVKLLKTESKASLRGMSVVDDKTVWVSGSNGTVGRSVDGGDNWKWITVKGFEKTDFRDIQAFNKTTALIMGIGEPAYILRTVDGGENWQVVFENHDKGMFLDAMEFWNEQSGIVIGDPINGSFFVARTFNGGVTWQGIPLNGRPVADAGEACFASSGTNIAKVSNAEAVFVTGGLSSHAMVRSDRVVLPLIQGKETTGANSIAARNKKNWIVVGGDFNAKDATKNNAAITRDGGKTWQLPEVPPTGYRSCIEHIRKKQWITCGLNGVDISNDDGNKFIQISDIGFHVVQKAKKGKCLYFAGSGGRIGKLIE